MSNAFDKASLVMLPHAYEEGKVYSLKPTDRSGDFTFSRGTDTATRVGEDGYIKKEYANLLEQSNSFDTTWTTSNTSVTSGQSGHDGSSDAWLLSKSGANGRIQQSISTSGVSTFSVYAKANNSNYIAIQFQSTYAYFDLTTGLSQNETGGIISATSTNKGNGWYRCSIVFNISASSTAYIYPAENGNVSDTSGSIYIQDAQINPGLVAYPYLETTTAPVYGGLTDDMPRLDYSGGATCPSLLLEPSRTNVLAHSEFIQGSNFSIGDFISSPEGVANGVGFIPSATNSSHYISLAGSPLTIANSSVVFSFYVKEGTQPYLRGRFDENSFTKRCFFGIDLTDNSILKSGTGASNVEITFEDAVDGWKKVIFTATYDGTPTGSGLAIFLGSGDQMGTDIDSYAGDGSTFFHIYGLQLEQGSYPTSYIPTYGSSQTRAAETCSDAYTNSTGEYFSVFLDYSDFRSGGINGDDSINFKDSSGSTIFTLWGLGNGFTIRSFSGDSNGGYYTNYQFGRTAKALIRYDGSNINLFIDGVKETNLSPTETNWNQIAKVHSLWASDNKYRMNQFIIFDSALSDSECIALTQA